METKSDVRQDITSRVLAYLESGTVPWRKAWTSASSRPINAKTEKPYSGVNSLILGMAMFENADFATDHRFLTAVQANDLGLRIRKGEHAAARIVRMVEVDRRKAGKESEADVVAEENGKYLVMKTYPVFHASQLDPGLPPLAKPATEVAPIAAVGTIVNAMKSTGLRMAEGPFDPAYLPRQDLIRMPPMSSFKGADADDEAAHFYGTLLHEVAHSVGAPHRNARFGLSSMTLQERAMEELVAEWSAAMLCADIKGIKLGEDHVQQHAAYLASWMQALKDDKGAIFRAATAAQKTCDYIERLVGPKAVPNVSIPNAPKLSASNDPAIQESVLVSVPAARRKVGPR